MDDSSISLVRQSWEKVLPIAPQAGTLFYENLFALNPELRALFRGDMAMQSQKLMSMIAVAVDKLDDPASLIPVLQSMGKRHASYGVDDQHYETVGAALLTTLSQGLGEEFTAAVRAAWIDVYAVMSKVMIDAAHDA